MHKGLIGPVFLLFFWAPIVSAQTVYYHTINEDVYTLIDELANIRAIQVNTAVKPYSRKQIAEWLQHAQGVDSLLNRRQKAEIEFYLKDFKKELLTEKYVGKRLDLFYYRDSFFSMTINPILGGQAWSTKDKLAYHRWGGGEAFATIGKHIGLYASLRDNGENGLLGRAGYRNDRIKAVYKLTGDNKGEYSEMRGGITFTNNWLTFGLVKDHFEWGNNYSGSNIYSARGPSFGQLRLKINPVDWFELSYVHGWLVSGVIDSSRSYVSNNSTRQVEHAKYVAANFITLKPFRHLYVTAGNSIVYSDIGIQAAYLIPFLFYKSVDHTLNSTSNYTGQNAQMFFDISSRNLRNLHLFTSVYIDEINFGNFFDPDLHSNWFSIKLGGRVSNVLLDNMSITAEYTRTNPMVYKHFISTTTFASNDVGLGDYLGDNAERLHLALAFKPIPRLQAKAYMDYARTGEDYPDIRQTDDDYTILGLPFIEKEFFLSRQVGLECRYLIRNDLIIQGGIEWSDISGLYAPIYAPSHYQGSQVIISSGLNFGF